MGRANRTCRHPRISSGLSPRSRTPSFKYSGLANLETVGVEDNTRGITLKMKNKKNSSNPKRNVVSVDLKKDFRKVAATIRNKTEGKFYRQDLSNAALARWYKIW